MANEMATNSGAAAANVDKQPKPVDLIVTHFCPHFDEVLAVCLLKEYGQELFPGVEGAGIETWGEGKMLNEYAGKTADGLLEQKMLCVGTCGGMFDEHVNGEKTCAHLVAEFLGIANRPELRKVLQFCNRVDHDGHSMPFDLHSTMKEMYEFYGDDDNGMQTVLNWAMRAIESHVGGQRQFHACAEEFKRAGGKIINGGPVKIALVQSDNPKMHKWIRHTYSADVIVKMRSSGNMIILTSAQKVKKIIDMRDLARIVRMMELQKRRKILPDWETLEATGTPIECPWWYYYANGEQLLNGTSTSPDIQPTVLTLNEVAQAVAISCAPTIEPCNQLCFQACNKYPYGLIACRQKQQ